MNNPTIDEAMRFPWLHSIEETPAGGFRLTVIPPIKDFELFAATSQELETDWHDALRSHLIGYIESGKIVPVPHPRIQQQSNTKGTAGGVQQFMVTDGEVVPT